MTAWMVRGKFPYRRRSWVIRVKLTHDIVMLDNSGWNVTMSGISSLLMSISAYQQRWLILVKKCPSVRTYVRTSVRPSIIKLNVATSQYMVYMVVDGYYNLGQYLSFVWPDFPFLLSFSFYRTSKLIQNAFFHKSSDGCKSVTGNRGRD